MRIYPKHSFESVIKNMEPPTIYNWKRELGTSGYTPVHIENAIFDLYEAVTRTMRIRAKGRLLECLYDQATK